ncbi:MAG TPA: ATP-dependent helicase [Acetobacteraceae bacterium]|jgi:DNA helicase II / ATP-dependent DNA helicase PcrA|nr:ATP-dependent helicase [Acetobacteraceae bacterium]
MRHLDPAQTAAAKGTAPVQLTLAGPGSGKTSALTGRFVHLVRQGINPTRILAMTFTKKAADEMCSRIAGVLELPSAARLNIMTFHAFAFRLLRRNPGVAGLPERFQLWDTPEQRRVFTTRQMWWNEEQDILDIIGGAKECLLDAAGFEATINTDDDVLVEAVRYFRVYEQALSAMGAIDFADMVPLVVMAMTTNTIYRRSITDAYDHMLVDEYQDVNPGQIKLIDNFINDGVGFWAVGDDDQTLYSFRASDVRHILEFTTRYPAATTHVLDRNYRSAPEIVRAAKRLVRHNRARIDKDYQPVVGPPGELVIRGYPSPEIEARQVAGATVKLLEQGRAVESIAILYRTATVGLPFQSILKDFGVPFDVRGGADLWQSVAARLVVGSLTYLRDGNSPEAMSRLGSNKRAEIVREQLDQIRVAVRGQFTAAAAHVRRIVGEAVPARASEREAAEWNAVVDAVVALAHSCVSLDQLENRIAEQSRSVRNPLPNAVVLSTIHSAKGLEWDTVFLVGVEDGVLPHTNCKDLEEERRVAYVGMTRARRQLGLTYSAERYGQKSRPSPFLFEIGGKEQRHCIWTGPRSNGADEHLPLISENEQRQLIKIVQGGYQGRKVRPRSERPETLGG